MDAIVIGAGAAGLSAARALHDAGLEVLVLEARERIGGRIHTLHLPDWPLPIEAGAEFVHGRPPALLPLAARRKELPQGGHYTEGMRRRDELWRSVMDKLGSIPARRERTVREALGTLRWKLRTSREEQRLAAEFIEGFNAARIDRASVKAIAQQTKASEKVEGDRLARLPQGYDAVPRRLARGLHVELATRVRAIRWQRGGVKVMAGRTAYVARSAVITVPLGVLQDGSMRFDPELPPWKRRAVAALAMGPVVKIALLFDRPHWPDELVFLHARGAPVPTFWRMLPSQAPALMGWAAARNAQRLTARNAVPLALDSLQHALGKRVRPVATRVFDWQRDPHALGAYSWVPVGALDAQRELARPVPPLFFAGEASHFAGACGTVHGALETGERAAVEVLNLLRRRKSRP